MRFFKDQNFTHEFCVVTDQKKKILIMRMCSEFGSQKLSLVDVTIAMRLSPQQALNAIHFCGITVFSDTTTSKLCC